MPINICWAPGSTPMRNAVRVIAILDLTFMTIPLIFETVNVGYLLGFVDPFEYLKHDCEQFSEDFSEEISDSETGTLHENNAHCSWTYSTYKELSEGNWTSKNVQGHIKTYTVASLILFIFIGGIIEGHLFSLLRRAVREEVHHWCKKWCWSRLILLILISGVSIIKIYRSHYGIIDGIYDITKIYRVITLLIVKLYMWELERTVGVTYVHPIKEPKQGSLGQDIHLLD